MKNGNFINFYSTFYDEYCILAEYSWLTVAATDLIKMRLNAAAAAEPSALVNKYVADIKIVKIFLLKIMKYIFV